MTPRRPPAHDPYPLTFAVTLPDLPGALCAELGHPELFFPLPPVNDDDNQGRQDYADDVASAKGVCARCPQVEACLAWALANGVAGIWGGTTSRERRSLLRRRPLKVA